MILLISPLYNFNNHSSHSIIKIIVKTMNEQRTQAYVNLIEQLLTCADDKELNNILQANQKLKQPLLDSRIFHVGPFHSIAHTKPLLV